MELLEHHTEGWEGDRDTQVKRCQEFYLESWEVCASSQAMPQMGSSLNPQCFNARFCNNYIAEA